MKEIQLPILDCRALKKQGIFKDRKLIGDMVKAVHDRIGNRAVISVHCHNDLGLGVANTLEAIKNGVTQVECTVNGIGERAGNTALEEIIATIKTKENELNVKTNIDSTKIKKISNMVIGYTHSKIQHNKAVVGKNAFLHEAGIHQQGVLSNPSTYEVLNPKDYGITSNNIMIGIHSGKSAIINKMEQLHYNSKQYDIEKIINEIKKHLTIHKKLFDKDLRKIVEMNNKL